MTAANYKRRALITGGTGALGSAVVALLSELDVDCVYTWHNNQPADTGTDNCQAIQLDLTDNDSIDRLVDNLREKQWQPDALIFCAVPRVDLRKTEPDDVELNQFRQVQLDGPARLVRLLLNETGFNSESGMDIVLTAGLTTIQSAKLPMSFNATQGAVASLAHAMAKEYGLHNIRINMAGIGLLTAGLADRVDPAVIDEYCEYSPLKRRSTPEEVAQVIAWLALNNTYMNGLTLLV